MRVPLEALLGRTPDFPHHEEIEDGEHTYENVVTCTCCGEEHLHWRAQPQGRNHKYIWRLYSSQGDRHECPPVKASDVFSNLDEESSDEELV